MAVTTKRLGAASVFSVPAAWAGNASAEMRLNFPEPAAGVAQEIYDIHMLTSGISTVLLVIIFAVVGYSLVHHRKSRGYEADQNFHETWFGHWAWVIVPVWCLGVDLTIASSAQKTLEKVWEVPKGEDLIDVKVIGHQWWWEFEYLDHSVEVDGKPKHLRWRAATCQRTKPATGICAKSTTRWCCRWAKRSASCTPPPTCSTPSGCLSLRSRRTPSPAM